MDKRNIENIYPLTPLQQGILFHHIHDGGSNAYTELLSLKIAVDVDISAMKQGWDFVVQENEVLRTIFKWKKLDKPLQIVLKQKAIEFEICDISQMEDNDKIHELEKIKGEEVKKGFDLEKNGFRVLACKISENQWEMMIINHHIILDGWSTTNIIGEFIQAYNGIKSGKTLGHKSKIKYVEYIKKINSINKEEAGGFWSKCFEGYEIPLVDNRKHYHAEKRTEKFHLSKKMSEDFANYSKENNATFANIANTAFGYILSRYEDNNNYLVGTVVSGRNIELDGLSEVAGLFINTLPLVIEFNKGDRMLDGIQRVKKHMIERAQYEHTSLMELKEIIGIKEYNELFDTLIVVENYPFDANVKDSEYLKITDIDVLEETNYNLTITFVMGETIEVSLAYNTDIYNENEIKRMFGHFETLVGCILNDEDVLVENAKILTEIELDNLFSQENEAIILNEHNQLQPMGIFGIFDTTDLSGNQNK